MISHFVTNTSFAGLLVYSSTLKPCSYVTLSFIYPVYKQLVHSSTRLLVNFKNLVPMLLCLLFTLSTSNLFTRLLVYSSTLKPCSYVTLSFIYPVYKQLVHSSTRWLVHLPCCFVFFLPCLQATRLLVYSLTRPLTMLLCLLFTLSTSNSFTRLLVYSSTFSLFCHFIFLPFNFLFIFALSFEK